MMDLYAVIDQIVPLLHKHGRMTYRAIKYQFQLDDEGLAILKDELIEAQGIAVDQDGKILVWTGGTTGASSSQFPALQTPNSDLSAGERRQLTVMFCDLVGSTTLSEQLDPEELREVVQAYYATCAGVIHRYAGYTAQHLGDGLLVYFGYPVAHEDEAARAVRTALEIVAGLQLLNTQLKSTLKARLPHPVQVRIGIHTGLVVIGEIGSSEKRELLALGETPNLAARLQGVAEPDMVVISAATQQLVPGLFESQDLGTQRLKGLSTPVPVYRVVREREAQSRFAAAVYKGLTPLVGRAEELALLQGRWEQAKQGTGQVVLLSGEPGIGKSRLVRELTEQLTRDEPTRMEFHCSPYHQSSALSPIIDHLQRLLQFAREDSSAVRVEKLQHMLRRYRFPQVDTVPLLASLLSLPHPEGSPPLTGSPQKQKEKTQAALSAWLGEEAERHPVYTIWEDLHWADPSTLEMLTLYLEQIPTTRIFTVLTYRPDFTPPWGSHSYFTLLTLNRLGHKQVETLVEHVAGSKALPAEVMRQIVARTDGVPLFVEELTKTVVEAGFDGGVQQAIPGPLTIPATLQDSLMARLDRLGLAKETAQLGAAIGREFSYELLHAVSSLNEATLQRGLKQLVEAELVYQRGLAPQTRYLFKHALVQDTAYQALLKSTRQHYHRQIAQALVDRFPGTIETQPELVAHHYTEAGLIDQALPYWQRAGERATQRSAHREAINHLTRALALVKTLPETLEYAQQELTLQMLLSAPLIALNGFASAEVEHAATRAWELCQHMGESPHLFPVLMGLWLLYFNRGELQTAQELAEQSFNLAKQVQDPTFLMRSHGMRGCTLLRRGEPAAAKDHLEQSLALYDPPTHRPQIFRFGYDPKMAYLSWMAWSLWLLGYPDQALARAHEALSWAQELAHPHTRAWALGFLTLVQMGRRDWQATRERTEEAMTLSTEQGFPLWLANATFKRGAVLAQQGQGVEGIEQMRQSLAAHKTMGQGGLLDILVQLAQAYRSVGQPAEGLTVLVEALEQMEKTGERQYEAEVYRLKGELTFHQSSLHGSMGKEAEAEAWFQKAIGVARRQRAKSWELRAATSLARLWQEQGKRDEAHQLLAEIYGWFTEGFDTKDLQEAKILLEQVSR